MRSFLCTDLVDFAASELGRSPAAHALPTCDPGLCPGLGHLQEIADAIAGHTGRPAADLLRRFGSAVFVPLLHRYPAFVVGIHSTLDLVTRFDRQVAAEVEKLVPRLHVPRLAVTARSGRVVEIAYRSGDGLADLATGLLQGSIRHFAEPLAVEVRAPWDGTTGTATLVLRPASRPSSRAVPGGAGTRTAPARPPVPSSRPPPRT